MARTIIAFGKNTLIIPLPNDRGSQSDLVADAFVCDAQGVQVTTMPADGVLNPSIHYCVPLHGLVNLMHAIGRHIEDKAGGPLELVLADPVCLGCDEQAKAAVFNCLNAAFGDALPVGFSSGYWSETGELLRSARDLYLRECRQSSRSNGPSIYEVIKRYKAGESKALPESVGYFYLGTSDTGQWQEDFLALTGKINAFTVMPDDEKSINTLLLKLYDLRFEQSVKSVVQTFDHTMGVTRVVFITTQLMQKKEIEEIKSDKFFVVYTDHLLSLMMHDGQSPVVLNDRNVSVIVQAMLQAVGSPFVIFAAYMFLLNHEPTCTKFPANDPVNGLVVSKQVGRYFGDHFFITHRCFDQAFGQTHVLNHESLNVALRDMVDVVSNQGDVHHHDTMQCCIEVIAARFTGFLGGKQQANTPLVAIIHNKIIQEFESGVTIYGDHGILSHLFLMWVSSQLHKARPNDIRRFLGDLRQFAASYNRPRELFERTVRTMKFLAGVVSKEIERLRNTADQRINLEAIAGTILAETRVPDEHQQLRTEIFTINSSQSVTDFLERHVRFQGAPNRNVSFVYAKKNSTTEQHEHIVVAIICSGDNGVTYYRRDARTNELAPNSPLSNLPILTATTTSLPDSQQELSIEWSVSQKDLYIGVENLDRLIVPYVLSRELPVFSEGSVLATFYTALFEDLQSSSVTDREAAREILVAIENLNLVALEAQFLVDSTNPVVSRMQELYRFMQNSQEKKAFFSYSATPSGVAATMNARGEKWLAAWNIFLSGVVSIVIPTLISGCKSSVIPVIKGDLYLYVDPKNPLLMRAACLIIFTLAPTEIVRSMLNSGIQLMAERRFRRVLATLPENMSHAIRAGSVLGRTFPVKVQGVLSTFLTSSGTTIPRGVSHFMVALQSLAQIYETSAACNALPPNVNSALMASGEKLVREIMTAEDHTSASTTKAVQAMSQTVMNYLKGSVTVEGMAAVLAGVFAGVYYGLVNTEKGDIELSDLTRSGLFALGIAALYLLRLFFVSTLRSGMVLYQHKQVCFWMNRSVRDAQPDEPASLNQVTTSAAPGDVQADDANERTPLTRSTRGPGSSRRICSCTLL